MPTSVVTTPLSRLAPVMLSGRRLSPEAARFNEPIITPNSFCSCGVDLAALAVTVASGSTYPAANRAIAWPFEIAAPFLVRKVFWVNIAGAGAESYDVGVYTEAGALRVSSGGTVSVTPPVMQEVDVTDTLLRPGRYWLAYVCTTTTANNNYGYTIPVAISRAIGCAQMDTAYPLPATFVPAAITSTVLPMPGIAARTLAA